MMASEPPVVALRHPPPPVSVGLESSEEASQVPRHKKMRPKSSSYEALRSAVYQLTRMADFKVEVLLGSGFFADVYKVKHKSTGEQMVLKMNKSKKTSKTMLAEIQLLNRLSHPNILRFRGSCVHEGQLHALTEYINGGSLEELLMDKSFDLPWSVRLQIAKDIARGMVYLHSKNVFHRDLNPKNCLIQREKDGSIRTIVADFGLAAKIKQKRRRSYTEVVGSAYWMAPECLHGHSYCEQADVFSYGITLAEIITRIPADPDYMPRRKDFGMDMPALRELCLDCPEPFLELVEKCCLMDPDERPCFEEVLDFLETVHLPEGSSDMGAEVMRRISSSTSQKDLRSSVSEPILRTSDDLLEDDIDGIKTCDDEDLERTQVVVRSLRLDSMGSSNGSSIGSVVDDSYGSSSLDVERGSGEFGCSRHAVATFPNDREKDILESSTKPISNARFNREDNKGLNNESSFKIKPDKAGRGNTKNGNCLPQKSLSTSNSASDLPPSLDPCGKEKNPSMQTLLAEEGIVGEGDNEPVANPHRGGGDSGIDPGEMDIFKFPLQQQHHHRHQPRVTAVSLAISDRTSNSGDHTPVCCTSPEPTSNSGLGKIGPIAPTRRIGNKGVSITPVLSPSCSTPNLRESTDGELRGEPAEASKQSDPIPNLSPTHSSFSHSRTSSVDASASLLIGEQSQSPLAPSWASSDFSFVLPSPSTPWAPPSSPALLHNRHSLPSSPSHRHSPYNTFRRHHSPLQSKPATRPHRYSQEITTSHPPCLRKVSSSSKRPKSCRNSALFSVAAGGDKIGTISDLQIDFEKMMKFAKTVHFMENEEPSFTTDLYHKEGMARQRSTSSPSRNRKTSATLPADRKNVISLREYGITLKTDLIDFDATCSSKYYKITPVSNTRLSSSTPDLSKLSLRSSPC